MSTELNATDCVDWVRPPRCPEGIETEKVYTGNSSDALAGIEVALARWTKPGEPSRQVLVRLHGIRVNERTTPVVLAVETMASNIVLFGPNTDVVPSKPIPRDQALRNLQVVLEASDQLAARDQLANFLLSLDTASIPGLTNSGLFATHELRTGVPNRPDWEAACQSSTPLLGERDYDLIAKLGFKVTNVGPYALVLEDSGAKPEAIAVMLEEAETFDADSHRFSISPVAYGLKLADQKRVPWLILTKGHRIRLYPARIDLGVGRKGLAETFFELDLPHLTEQNAGYLSLIFSADALADGGSAFEIMAASAQYGVALGSRLRNRVYEEIVPVLSVAVANQLAELGYEMDAEGLDLAYQLTLRIFFRMLFQTYAEDRKLLPYGESQRYDRNALKTVARDLHEEPDQSFDPESTTYWDDLLQVWHVIDKGDRAWGVPAYNGGLFSSDEELQPQGALIEGLHLTNDVIGPCLKALLLDRSDDEEYGPVDFRTLSVREFGTIYEGLLESSLGLAEVDLTLDAKDTWVPAKRGDEVFAGAGEVYFHNTSGQRKGTGSYYTPTFVVEHLLERSLDPALDEHLGKVAEHLANGDQGSAAELFFDFRVADLAMGSGHFLTAAIDHIEAKMAAFLEEEGRAIPGVTAELIALETAASDAVGPDAVKPERSSLLRRQIGRRCIYGLDLNPISVELAKVSIWIHTFVRGLPMSSLDHNLVCANSLTGIGSIDEALDVLVPNRNNAGTLFDGPIVDALNSAKTVLTDAALLPELNRTETQAASRAVKKAVAEAEEAKLLFDGAVLLRIGRVDLIDGRDAKSIAAQAGTDEAQEAVSRLQPGHMPVLFPEVFLRDNGGFDVLVGNPPWEELMLDEVKFWLRIYPGLLGIPSAQRHKIMAELRTERAELLPELSAERQLVDDTRAVLLSGPYPGIGTGDVDLYQVFAWRNWQLVRENGRIGAVFPRTLLNSAGCALWRMEVLESSDLSILDLKNTRGWVFPEVAEQYSFVLLGVLKTNVPSGKVLLCGPYGSLSAFKDSGNSAVSIDVAMLQKSSTGSAFPQLPDSLSAEIFAQLRQAPRLDDGTPDWEFRPVAEFHATNDRKIFDAGGEAPDRWPVYGGSSFNIWEPDTGERFAWADPSTVIDALQSKRQRQVNLRSSAFYGMSKEWSSDPLTLPCFRPRIAYRQITRSTDPRTVKVSLVPGNLVLNNAAPYLFRVRGGELDEAYVLGLMSSHVFDWYGKRYIELNLNFHILNGFPIPEVPRDDLRQLRLIELSSRLAARDDRFADWAEAVGVPVGSVGTEAEQADMEAELDALVAHLYGLSRKQVQHIFKTFHRGWDYQPRLDAVLEHFDMIDDPA